MPRKVGNLNILLLTANHTIAVSVARCLQYEHNVYVIGAESAQAAALFSCCKKFYQVPDEMFSWPDQLIDIIERINQQHDCSAIMPTDVNSALFLSQHYEALSKNLYVTPVPDAAIIRILDNKWDFYQLLQRIEQPSPRTVLINSKEDGVPEDFKFPALSKPLQQGGGIGILHHRSAQDFANSRASMELPVILQEFIPGPDIDCSLLSINGEIKAWTIQQHVYGGLEFVRHDEVLSICSQIVSDIHYTGVTHFDLRIDERNQKPGVLECNPRFWATTFRSMQVGVNFPVLLLKYTQEEPLNEVMMIKNETWIATKLKIMMKEFILSGNKRCRWKPFISSYRGYLRRNLAGEVYRIMLGRNERLASRWLQQSLKYGYTHKIERMGDAVSADPN